MKWMLCLTAAIAAVSLGVKVTQASGPVAVYALVDKVTFEPNADHPDRIQISGTFILSSVPDGCGSASNPCSTTYSSPQSGYLYCSLPDQRSDQALHEWADVKSVAGTRQVVGFGGGWFRNDLKVRKTGEKPDSPQPWPVNNNGVMRVSAEHPQAKALLDFNNR
jgi:hypothetical protein